MVDSTLKRFGSASFTLGALKLIHGWAGHVKRIGEGVFVKFACSWDLHTPGFLRAGLASVGKRIPKMIKWLLADACS